MANNRTAADPGSDGALRNLEEKVSNCLKARAEDWAIWQEKHVRQEEDLREARRALRAEEGKVERLHAEIPLLTRELERLKETDLRLRQAQSRIAQLGRQGAGYQEEIDRLLSDLATAEATTAQLRRQEQLLQGRTNELEAALRQTRELLDAYSEPNRLLPEALHNLLRASFGLDLELTSGLRNHIAQPEAVVLEVFYKLVRLVEGRPWSELPLSDRLKQVLEEQRRRG